MATIVFQTVYRKLSVTIIFVLVFLFSPNMISSQVKPDKGKTISIEQMILKKKNKPNQKKLLIKFKNEYSENDRIVVEEFRGYFKIIVDHPDSNGSTGGAECYKLDKKTGKREMIWHEHPMEIPQIDLGDDG